MRFLVTGGTGYIGSAIVKALLQQGFYVRATTRSLAMAEKIKQEWLDLPLAKLTWHECDFTKANNLAELVQDCDYVLHVASPVPKTLNPSFSEMVEPALAGVRAVMQAVSNSKVKRVVLTSSIASMRGGQPTSKVFNAQSWTDLSQPVGAYAFSKTVAELHAWALQGTLPNMPELVTVLPGFVVGVPAFCEQRSASMNFMRRILSSKLVMPASFNLVALADVVAVHIQAALAENPSKRLPVANYDATSLFTVVEWLQAANLVGPKFKLALPKALLPKKYQVFLASDIKIDSGSTYKQLSLTQSSIKQAILAMAAFIIKQKI